MNIKDKIYTFITSKVEKESVSNVKVGQLLTEVLEHTRTHGLELEIIAKGFNADDVQNSSFDLEKGDIVSGWKTPNIYWPAAIFLGGDPDDRDNNYLSGTEIDYTDTRLTMWD